MILGLLIKVTRSSKFDKQYSLALKRGFDASRIHQLIGLLVFGDPLPPLYRDKKLTGDLNKFRSARLGGDWCLIYYRYKDELHFVAIGTHSDLFKK